MCMYDIHARISVQSTDFVLFVVYLFSIGQTKGCSVMDVDASKFARRNRQCFRYFGVYLTAMAC